MNRDKVIHLVRALVVNERFQVLYVIKLDDDLALHLGGSPPNPPSSYSPTHQLTNSPTHQFANSPTHLFTHSPNTQAPETVQATYATAGFATC